MDRIKELCEYTGIPFAAVEAGRISEQEESNWKKLFFDDETAFYVELDNFEKRYETALFLYMKWAAESYEDYKKAGLSDEIYFANYIDMGIWYRTCLEQTGIHGIKEYRWTSLPLKRRIFRLGRLQFEPSHLREDVDFRGCIYKKGTPMLEVHIPEGDALTEEKVKDAFQKAQVFFKKNIPYVYDVFYCESWLLSPHVKELLTEESNILKFQSLFYVYKELESKQAEERVFRCVKKNPQEYPEETCLQFKLKRYMLEGNSIGMGYGIIKRL